MKQENHVIFKGTKDGIAIRFLGDIPFDTLCEQLQQKVTKAGKFFDHVKTALILQGRTFSEEEENRILEIITNNTTMTITYLKVEDSHSKRLIDLCDNLDCMTTKFHKGSLRNGQTLEFDGSLVLLGDVNPGAEVKATGNIIVLGQLRGIAHAGCNGLTDAFIAAIHMLPVQLRIADIITRFPNEEKRNIKPAEYAFVQEGQIFVMPLS